jgi:formyltetrahydrofolate hydrolase
MIALSVTYTGANTEQLTVLLQSSVTSLQDIVKGISQGSYDGFEEAREKILALSEFAKKNFDQNLVSSWNLEKDVDTLTTTEQNLGIVASRFGKDSTTIPENQITDIILRLSKLQHHFMADKKMSKTKHIPLRGRCCTLL